MKSFWKSRNLFVKRFLAAGGIFGKAVKEFRLSRLHHSYFNASTGLAFAAFID